MSNIWPVKPFETARVIKDYTNIIELNNILFVKVCFMTCYMTTLDS